MEDAGIETMHRKKLEELASKPNTVVYDVEYDSVAEAWPASRVERVIETVYRRITEDLAEESCDFKVRKYCLKDEEVLAFQRRHPKLYWMITDREKMKEPKYRGAITAMVEVRKRVERGEIPEGKEADAAATRTGVNALSGKTM